jgi:hypothetical protein
METKFFPEDCVFIQADVESMYPSIDITNGLQTLQKTLEERRTPHDKTTAILQLTAWVLKNNFMVFNQEIYKQLNGTAMGSPLSVTYACLYIAYKEQIAIRQLLYRGLPDPIIYRRMVDDIAAVVRDMNSALTLMKLLETNVDKGIKFEYQISKDKLIFMDLEIFKTDELKQRGKLDTTLYQKPMNKYLFLPFQSAHPLSVFKAWITCYIQRIRILCSIDEMFETHKEKFRNRLRRRGYPIRFLDQVFGEKYSRNILLLKQQTRKERNNNSENGAYKAAFTLPLCEHTERIKKSIKKCLRFTTAFQQDPHFKDILGTRKTPMIIYDTQQSLGQNLVRAKIPVITSPIE